MRPFTALFVLLFVVSACAPSRTASGGAATPPPARATPTEPSVQPEPAAPPTGPAEPDASAPVVAPERWWLLDAEVDGVHGASVDRAYRELLAGKRPRRTVVVAIIDSGIDIEHEDLKPNLWVNEGEIPGNGKDDDGNGYVDDVHGWNFIGGPDGQQVHQDTYEVTRLYAACQSRFGGADPDTLRAPALREYEQCQEIDDAYEAERAEARQMIEQIRMMQVAVTHYYGLLREYLGTDSLTVERVAAIQSPRMDLRQARQVYLDLAANDITPELIAKELDRLEKLMEYGLNPSFDPRGVVGDNYADETERIYGNADVVGPDPHHGTHVAGIIGAVRDNGIGVDGIAPDVRLMVLRAVPDGDERDKDVANAIRYAAENGAHIINMSFGKGFSPAKSAVDEAVRFADSKGVLMIHAAGNDGKNLDEEANFPNRYYEAGDSALLWLEVGASAWHGPDRLAAHFSNYGKRHVHLFAPGVGIRSTVPGGDYEPASGTSMAAPVVSGIAALLMAYYPELDAYDVRRILLDSATRYEDLLVARPGDDAGRVPFTELSKTGGIINAYAAIRMAEELVASRRN